MEKQTAISTVQAIWEQNKDSIQDAFAYLNQALRNFVDEINRQDLALLNERFFLINPQRAVEISNLEDRKSDRQVNFESDISLLSSCLQWTQGIELGESQFKQACRFGSAVSLIEDQLDPRDDKDYGWPGMDMKNIDSHTSFNDARSKFLEKLNAIFQAMLQIPEVAEEEAKYARTQK